MVVASQQITVKVGPAVAAEGRHGDGEGHRERTGRRERERKIKGERGARRRKEGVAETGRPLYSRPLHKRYAACRRYADTFILTVMR